MSLRARKPRVIVFILGAFLLGALMVFSFGGRNLISRHETFVLYFGESVSGLRQGSLVEFKGVPIGLVESVHEPGKSQRVPVVIQLNADRMHQQLGDLASIADPTALAAEVRRGLRAQIEVESYVTGGMYVELDYHAKAPPPSPNETGPDVIPTLPSKSVANLQFTQDTIAWLPTFDFKAEIAKAGDNVDSLTTKISVFPYAEYSQKIIDALKPVAHLDIPSWQQTENNALGRLNEYQDAIATGNDRFSTQSEYFMIGSQNIRQNLDQINTNLVEVRANLQPGASWFTDLDQSIKDIGAQLQRFGDKANAFEDQPDVLNRGSQ